MLTTPVVLVARAGLALAIAASLLATACQAQEGSFGNASLRWTYAFSMVAAAADSPVYDFVSAGLTYFDGGGHQRAVFFVTDLPGEPDADGNPRRIAQRTVSDPSLWTYIGTANPRGRYHVTPYGMFNYTLFSTLDGLPTRVETIDGVPTIVEYELFSRGRHRYTGGVSVWKGRRIADGDVLPRAPE